MPKATVFITKTVEYEMEIDVPDNMITEENGDSDLTLEGWEMVYNELSDEHIVDQYIVKDSAII